MNKIPHVTHWSYGGFPSENLFSQVFWNFSDNGKITYETQTFEDVTKIKCIFLIFF